MWLVKTRDGDGMRVCCLPDLNTKPGSSHRYKSTGTSTTTRWRRCRWASLTTSRPHWPIC